MNNLPHASPQPARLTGVDRFGVIPWILLFVAIIAGAVVAVIAWTVAERFLTIIILLLAGFLISYLLGPLMDRLERGGVPRVLAILLVYIIVLGALAIGITLLVGPLTAQLQGLTKTLPVLLSAQAGKQTGLDRFFAQHGIHVTVAGLRGQVVGYVTGAGTTLLNSTLGVVLGLVNLATDAALVLVIAFYVLLDGRAMHNRIVAVLPTASRQRWFFVEAALTSVVGGYIRGQLIVAATVGSAAGLGCWALGVHYPLVIGVLAFIFELIPLIGPVLGMIPAVVIALFQPLPLAVWVVVFFIALQQVESNLIVPRVSGHAVGLHPLGALLALLAGVELGGLGGALIGVPVVGVLWVMAMALYADATGQSRLLAARPRRNRYAALAQGVLARRRGRAGAAAGTAAGTPAPVALASVPEPQTIQNERLATIAVAQEQLIEQFEADQATQAATDHVAATKPEPSDTSSAGPNDLQAPTAI